MPTKQPTKAAIIVPNWNGAAYLHECLVSLTNQTYPAHIIVVDGASTDESVAIVRKLKDMQLIQLDHNRGFAGGVNPGIVAALEDGFEYIALFNNDAVAEPTWLEELVTALDHGDIAASLILQYKDRSLIDSAGEQLSKWGLPYPSFRNQSNPKPTGYPEIFAASGGACVYKREVLEDVGLFDEAFFAYLEDCDLSFRARLRGYKIVLAPRSRLYHRIGATSSRLGHFGRSQFLRNSWYLVIKDVPGSILVSMLPRFAFVQTLLFAAAVRNGAGVAALRSYGSVLKHLPTLLVQRRQIQSRRTVPPRAIADLLTSYWPLNRQPLRRKKASTP